MFTKLTSLLVLVAPLVSAITLSTPIDAVTGSTSVNAGETVNVTWTSVATDSTTFTLELAGPLLNNEIALANNIPTSNGVVTFTLPIVNTGPSYTLVAVDIANISDVFNQTPNFSIGNNAVSTSTAASATGTNSNTTPSANSLPASATTSGGATGTGTGTVTGSGTGTGTSGTGTGTSSGATTTPSTAAAASSRLALTNAGGYAVLLLSAVAGAAAIAL